MDALTGYGNLGLGSRLKRVSEVLMKESQLVYDHFNVDFDPYLFPIFKIITNKNGVTNSEIQNSLQFSQPAITQALNKLNKKELIRFETDSSDLRKKRIYPTEKGLKLLVTLKPIWKGIEKVIKEHTNQTSSSLLEHLNLLEQNLNLKRFSVTVIENVQVEIVKSVEIINFQDQYAKNFYELNIEWLKTYFYIEPFDEEVLSKPLEYIINKGGYIFFAKLNDVVVGTVALMPLNEENLFELTKMAVFPEHRGNKIGQQLMEHCIDFSKELGLPKLVLYSNRKLENAIYIYRKYGFIEVPLESNSPYKRSNIKMELKF